MRERNPEGLLQASSPKRPLCVLEEGEGQVGREDSPRPALFQKSHTHTHITVLLITHLRIKAEQA